MAREHGLPDTSVDSPSTVQWNWQRRGFGDTTRLLAAPSHRQHATPLFRTSNCSSLDLLTSTTTTWVPQIHITPPAPIVALPAMNYGKKDEDAETGLVKVDRTQVFQEGESEYLGS